MARIRWQTGPRIFGGGGKGHQSDRSFPIDASEPSDSVVADCRVMRGPTRADRESLPYVQEAWEWALRIARAVGLKRRKRYYPCALDLLTRMRMAALIERRNLAWPETAAMVAGLDPPRIMAEHQTLQEEMETYISLVSESVNEGLDDGWDGVVWGDIDPADPLRNLEIDDEVCEGCGRCVVVCPQVFTRAAGGEVRLTSPAAVRERELEKSCLQALSECPEGAIRLNSRGGRTATGVLPPRGRPLPGERKD